jgi:hypothetical protein
MKHRSTPVYSTIHHQRNGLETQAKTLLRRDIRDTKGHNPFLNVCGVARVVGVIERRIHPLPTNQFLVSPVSTGDGLPQHARCVGMDAVNKFNLLYQVASQPSPVTNKHCSKGLITWRNFDVARAGISTSSLTGNI